MEVIQERLEREFNLDLILTSPNVLYRVKNKKGELKKIRNPYHFPDPAEIETFFEPYTEATIVTPIDCMDAVFELCKSRRGEFIRMDYLGKDRLNIFFDLPLAEIVIDFYDKIKSITRGYASFDYEFKEYRETEIVKIDVMINSKPIEAFSILTHKTKSEDKAREIAQRLKNLIPRQMFELKIQAVIGSKVIASSKVPALRKNVTAKCYGGDVTRKRKLWEKQKKGKKKMKQMGNLQLPKKVFLEVLKI
jgi:GTP-binding protein LepA